MAMTQPADATATDLQFDRAEFGGQPASQTCAACQQPIADRYFDVNGQITCPTCRETIASTFEKDPGWTAPFIALGAGLAGGLVGALLYYAVLKLTGYEIGLIAIVVGLVVGRAVRWGSGGRGGRVYQVMAVAITYLAIVSTYVPFIIEGIRNSAAQEAAQGAASADGAPASGSASAPTQSSQTGKAGNDTSSSRLEAGGSSADDAPMTGGSVAVALVLLFLFVLATPFLAGFQNIIGLLIIGFALWEAWKSNRRVPLAIAGPFALAPAGGGGDAAVPPIPTVPPPLPPPDLPPAPAAS
jgi:hypothetical protein